MIVPLLYTNKTIFLTQHKKTSKKDKRLSQATCPKNPKPYNYETNQKSFPIHEMFYHSLLQPYSPIL
jgi:hypothetical protein